MTSYPEFLRHLFRQFASRLSDPGKRIIKKMGFSGEQLGLMNRYLREKTHWDDHLDKTKDFIKLSVGNRTGKKIAVLGSGWLMDVPLEFLLERFDKLLLYDLVHPPQIVHKYRHEKRIRFIRADLTGTALKKAFELSEIQSTDKIKTIQFRKFRFSLPVDYVISPNILSQLTAFPGDFLKEKTKIPRPVIEEFLKKIQLNHLRLLRQYPSCLISDILEMNYCKGVEYHEERTVFIDLPAAKSLKQWDWVFDKSGTYRENCESIYRVVAMSFVPGKT